MTKILIIDDEIDVCAFFKMAFSNDQFHVLTAYTADKALSLLAEQDFEVIFTDLHLPDMSGLDIVKHVKLHCPGSEVIVITGFASIETAVQAIKNGAYDYLTKPLALSNVRIMCQRAVEKVSLQKELENLRREVHHSYGFENIVGVSGQMQKIIKIIQQTIDSDSSVFITGESGTGKELVARAIHYSSRRKHNRFTAVNCAAISKDLVESELFGHVKGAFTGAVKDKVGFFETASSGTLFLDEISETPPEFQVKLLRVLQEGEFYSVGSTELKKMNARIIAATNQDIKKAVAEGRLREDLFYRLNVISIHLPPLRQRPEDIPLLLSFFIKKIATKINNPSVKSISPEALNCLMNYSFPGNIRELENIIEYAMTITRGTEITHESLPSSVLVQSSSSGKIPVKPLNAALAEYEKSLLTNALRQSQGNISQAAKLLHIHRQSLQRKIKDFSLDMDSFKN